MKTRRRKKGFMCGCGGSKSVSIVVSRATALHISPVKTPPPTTKQSSNATASASASVDALLRQLRELGVDDDRDQARRHRRSTSDGGRGRRLEEESVAVVKETADPLGDFRRSMAQMVVENEITGGAELRELLQRFLSLNSTRHHHLILVAFADVWVELFSGAGGRTQIKNTAPVRSVELAS